MIRQVINKLFLLLVCISIAACTGTRKLPPGQKLYTGADVKLIPSEKLRNKAKIIKEEKTAVRPKPNKKFLWMRPKLSLYMMAGDTSQIKKKRSIRRWMKKKGEPPVLLSEVKPGQTVKYIDAKLFNIGIFKGFTEYKVVEKRRTARIVYTSRVHNPYTVSGLKNEVTNDSIRALMLKRENRTLIEPGDDYSLDNLKKERDRIDDILKNNGYYFFDPDYLLFKADTSEATKTVSLRLMLKKDVPVKALTVYRINKVTIDPNYTLERSDTTRKRTPIVVDSVLFLTKYTRIKPKIILESVYLKQNEVYSRRRHNITLNRLMTIGMYKYVRVKFTEVDSNIVNTIGNNYLDMSIDLTPMQKRTIRTEFNIVSKSNDFIGPQANLNYRNRNVLKGAELLSVNLGGSFETQIIGKYKDLYSYSINPQIELYVPRFVVPFRIKKTNSYFVPKTRFSLGYNYVKRIAYFDMKTFQFIYGFKWKETAKKEHELNPININYTSVSNISAEFNALLEANPFVKKSYEDQFIPGGTYSFTYNEQIRPQKNQVYFNFYTEIAGNTFTLGGLILGKRPTEERPLRVAGSVYSQFAKASIDVRNYTNFESSKFVVRLFTGVGKPYGNSSTLPYIKQFFSGGPYSVRAFVINSLGPGTYEQRTKDRSVFIQQGGDIKLESNAEYRFDIIGYFKGAVFVDAGNVWLFKSNPAVVSPPFSFSTFYKEIAVGSGIGLRLDVKFFVLRFDLAMPLRKPWLPENERWVLNKINFGSGTWRSDNLILNVAIGYPF